MSCPIELNVSIEGRGGSKFASVGGGSLLVPMRLDSNTVECIEANSYTFVEPTCGEGDIIVTTSIHVLACVACVRLSGCVLLSGFVGVITCTFVHGFQNNLAHLFIR